MQKKWNNDKCQYKCKNPKEHKACDNDIWNPTTCSWENVEYLTRTINNWVISCDEIINAADSVLANGSANGMSAVSIKKCKI